MSRVLITDELGNPITPTNPFPVVAELSAVTIGDVTLTAGTAVIGKVGIDQAVGQNVVAILDSVSTGTITTQNLLPSGAATAGSAVEISTIGKGAVAIQITGTYTGALTPQGTVDGVTWVTIGGTPLIRLSNSVASGTVASGLQDIYIIDTSGLLKFRITGLSAMTGTATVTLEAALGNSLSVFTNGVSLRSGAGTSVGVVAPGNGDASANALETAARAQLNNGTTWDTFKNNTENTILASAARTATTTSADQINYNGRGVTVVLDVTVIPSGGLTLTIDFKDSVSGKYINLLTGASVSTVSTNVYRVYPSLTAVANSVVSSIVPRTYRVTVTAADGTSITYSVSSAININ